MTGRHRFPTDDERALFEAVARGAKALEAAPKEAAQPMPTKAPPKPRLPHGPRLTGIDGRTAERLAKGAVEPAARLDLHGLTELSAHRALATFLRGAAARGVRLTLVITGKGAKPESPEELFDPPARGVLKAVVPRWLHEPDLARFVADVRPAHRKHGGGGALYVYLRKPCKVK